MKYIVDFDALVEHDDDYLLLWPVEHPGDRLCFYKDDLTGAAGWLPADASKVHVIFTRDNGAYSLSMLPLEEVYE